MIEDQKAVLSNEHCVFLQMPQKVLKGSGLIVPREHRPTVFDLTEEEWHATFSLLKEVKKWLDDEDQPDGYTIGWNSGETGGQHIFHAHLHVIPRFKDEPYAGRGIRSWLKDIDNMRPSILD
jgi:histidine triad (HIT) family protein|nr:HIT domain-containing protein [Bacillus sp. V2I10]